MDDPLSAVDPAVGQHLFRRCIAQTPFLLPNSPYDSRRNVGLKVATFYFQGKTSQRAACRSEAVRFAIWARYQGT